MLGRASAAAVVESLSPVASLGAMSDVEGTVMDTDEEEACGPPPAAERLFAAEEFYLPVTSTATRCEDPGTPTMRSRMASLCVRARSEVLLKSLKRLRSVINNAFS